MLQAAPSSNSLPVEQFQRLAIADKDGEYATLFRRKDELKTKAALTSIGYAALTKEVQELRETALTTQMNKMVAQIKGLETERVASGVALSDMQSTIQAMGRNWTHSLKTET